jgi:hypothetical protein
MGGILVQKKSVDVIFVPLGKIRLATDNHMIKAGKPLYTIIDFSNPRNFDSRDGAVRLSPQSPSGRRRRPKLLEPRLTRPTKSPALVPSHHPTSSTSFHRCSFPICRTTSHSSYSPVLATSSRSFSAYLFPLKVGSSNRSCPPLRSRPCQHDDDELSIKCSCIGEPFETSQGYVLTITHLALGRSC